MDEQKQTRERHRRSETDAMALIVAALLATSAGITLARQDRYTLKVPDGLAFSDIRGYETWEDVAVSDTETGIKAILGNPMMIDSRTRTAGPMPSSPAILPPRPSSLP
ncbi:MAG TPA: hypothetical protein VE397_14655 [Stellaceae bacterium]|nr:hypothetical protein [Stellaceae bacterium]